MGAGQFFFLLAGLYALMAVGFVISENRRPQATLAWILALIFLPVLGLVIYFFFGRSRKAFSKAHKLLRQDLEENARPLLSPVLNAQEGIISSLVLRNPAHGKLMTLIRRNSQSALTLNRVEICQDAATFYPRLIDDMKAARHSIHHQYYIWRGDEVGRDLERVMMERARHGVEVRILYDPLGSDTWFGRRHIRDLQAAGVRMVPTAPIWHLHNLGYRNHRKISVIDGRVGYVGGMNIGREHIDGGKGFDCWRDTQVRLEGDGAGVLQAVFAVDWYNAVREDLFSPAYFPERDTLPRGDVAVQILTTGPDSQWAAIRQLYTSLIASAQRRALIQSPFFIPDSTMAESMTAAAMAGVDVHLMISARASGSRVPEWATNTYLAELCEAGVKVHLYEKGYLHAKTISVDSEVCSIGSANIDIRSFSINYEINAAFYDPDVSRRLEQDFERDLAFCTPFDPNAYARRAGPVRFRDSVARLLSPLL